MPKTKKCCCGLPMRADKPPYAVVESADGSKVEVGRYCAIKIRQAGADGYQPRQGPRLYWTALPRPPYKEMREELRNDKSKQMLRDNCVIVGDCWEWPCYRANDRDYAHVSINGKSYVAHRLSYHVFKGDIPTGKLVCHSCDNRICINPAHLWLGTHKENMDDMVAKGRNRSGRWENHV